MRALLPECGFIGLYRRGCLTGVLTFSGGVPPAVATSQEGSKENNDPSQLTLPPSHLLWVLSSPGAAPDLKLERMRPILSCLQVSLPSQVESRVEQAKKRSLGRKSVTHKRISLILVSINLGYPYQRAFTLPTYNSLNTTNFSFHLVKYQISM